MSDSTKKILVRTYLFQVTMFLRYEIKIFLIFKRIYLDGLTGYFYKR